MHTCNTVKLFSWTEMPPRLFVIDLICWWCSSLISLSFFSFSRRIWIESHKHKHSHTNRRALPPYFVHYISRANCFGLFPFSNWLVFIFENSLSDVDDDSGGKLLLHKKTKQKNFLVRSPLPNLPWSLVYTSKGIFTTPKTKTKTKKFFFRRIQRRKEQQRNKMIITITARLKKTRNDDDINYVSLRLEIVFSILS